MARAKVASTKPARQDIRFTGEHIDYHPVMLAISKAEAASALLYQLGTHGKAL